MKKPTIHDTIQSLIHHHNVITLVAVFFVDDRQLAIAFMHLMAARMFSSQPEFVFSCVSGRLSMSPKQHNKQYLTQRKRSGLVRSATNGSSLYRS
jgi:hypothetical protein